ncbi:DUF4249 domain-containing protein [Spirosoma gilvum]
MRSTAFLLVLLTLALPLGCVDSIDQNLSNRVDVLVVDGTITDLAELMTIRISRSQSDPLTGRFGNSPVTRAQVRVIEDSSREIPCHETQDGLYQLPGDFKGQVGHSYQLRFTLADGTDYSSTQQRMPAVPPIDQLAVQFNPTSVSPPFADNVYTAGHDVFLTTQDPVDQANYYRWDWTLYESQAWCHTCYEGIYAVNAVVALSNGTYQSTDQSFDDCIYPPKGSGSLAYAYVQSRNFDYPCRSSCWEIIHSHTINVFSDQYSNGGLIIKRPVAHIPFYQRSPCLVHIRQSALTKDAHQYFSAYQQQTGNTGGLADTPPTALAGNVHNLSNPKEQVVGYFTASSVFVKPYYIDRKDAVGVPPTLFYALNGRIPNPEPLPSAWPTFIVGGPARPPTALCAPIDQRTPFKPLGWPN